MLWSDDGKASTWSAPERFITGVTEGWQATWIAADKGWPVHIAESRKGADNPGPTVMPLFRRSFPVGKPVRHAVISISGLGHSQLSLNGRGTTASLLHPGWTKLRKNVLFPIYVTTGRTRCREKYRP